MFVSTPVQFGVRNGSHFARIFNGTSFGMCAREVVIMVIMSVLLKTNKMNSSYDRARKAFLTDQLFL